MSGFCAVAAPAIRSAEATKRIFSYVLVFRVCDRLSYIFWSDLRAEGLTVARNYRTRIGTSVSPIRYADYPTTYLRNGSFCNNHTTPAEAAKASTAMTGIRRYAGRGMWL